MLDADIADALARARLRFEPDMAAVLRDIRQLLCGRDPRQLVGLDVLEHFILRERYVAVAAAQAAYAEAEHARRQQRIAA